MSENTAPEFVTITVDGKELQAPKGAMLIEVTDSENIRVPRFCYHSKLSVAANCRMCLVEVEKAPKPLPACATPVMDGMVVHTHSKTAIDAQKSVMEFLLINHPLDCPICDQGGECELQDVAMGYGNEVSRYTEGKRVVFDRNIGPLIATELTRCIHCTRCVRFGTEIAGVRELGMTNRGENARIATYIEGAVTSEMSGNVVDVCPVGALTAKPSRYAARAWEMQQHATVAPHDCVGSNLFAHTLRGELIRVVPRDNEAINEVWISDRDRFSYEGVESDERLLAPMMKQNDEWVETSWQKALDHVVSNFRSILDTAPEDEEQPEDAEATSETDGAEAAADEATENEATSTDIAALVSPNATLEEMLLTQKLMRSLGSGNIDHRLRQSDFSDEAEAPVMPWLGQGIADLENLDAALLIGSNPRMEQPMINHRLRKASINRSAQIHFLNTRSNEHNFDIASEIAVAQQDLVNELSAIATALCELTGDKIPAKITSSNVTDAHRAVADSLNSGDSKAVLIGNQAMMHPQLSAIRKLAALIADACGAKFGYLTDGCNAGGAWLAGAVSHRGIAGSTDAVAGKNFGQLLEEPAAGTLLVNVEPDLDAARSHELMASLEENNFVVAITSYRSDALTAVADVLLPAAAFTETSGTYVNIEGFWQSFNGARTPQGESRPAWKILRVLGNLFDLGGFDQVSSEDVRDECRSLCESIELSNEIKTTGISISKQKGALLRCADVPIYAEDALVRRAPSLQETVHAVDFDVSINSGEAEGQGLAGLDTVIVKQGALSAQLKLIIDDRIPDGSAWMPIGVRGCELLGDPFGEITLEKAQS